MPKRENDPCHDKEAAKMVDKHITTHRKSHKGMSEQMANEINRHQAEKVQRKIGSRKMHPSKPKQGYTPNRSGVDVFFPKV